MTPIEMDRKLAEASLILHDVQKEMESDGNVFGYLDVAQFAIHRFMNNEGQAMQRLRAEGVAIRSGE